MRVVGKLVLANVQQAAHWASVGPEGPVPTWGA
ncbi:protein of unknown function (plasmid) [Streptantibioticus cattleyicolor NRRL 8057 = DSM 46488]|nr:protein of unknown function [Streptantibioticus cattleyicolor NRRL 8057 = DSM 46488]